MEFNLSEKAIRTIDKSNFIRLRNPLYFETDIKEFIKRLKDEIWRYPVEFLLEAETEANARDVLNDIASNIDKLAGDI